MRQNLGFPPLRCCFDWTATMRDATPLIDVLTAGLGVLVRSRDYHLLDLEVVRLALAHSPDQVCTHPESGMTRTLYDCKSIPLTPAGAQVRLVIATNSATSSSPAIGVERDGTVYELFVSTLPSPAFTASDVLDLYLHRGSFETVLADEDEEQDADRWYSHTRLSPGVLPDPREVGSGTCAWNWAGRSPRRMCAPPNLPKPGSSSLPKPLSFHPFRNTHLR